MLAVKDLVKLGDCCELNPCAPQNLPNILYSFVPMSAIGINGEIDNSEYRKLEDLKGGYSYFINGDVLFAKITPCMENGKGAVALNLKNNIGVGSTEFHVLRPKTNVISSYWLYLLTKTDKFRQAAEKSMTGSAGQKRVPISFIRNYQIALPIIAEQHRIEKIIYKINEILGFLEKKLNKFNMLINSRFVEMFGDLISNSQNRKLVRLEELGKWSSGGTPPKSNKPYFEGSINWFTAGELNSLYLNDSIDKISEEAIYETSAKLFTKGSMLVGMYDTAAFKLGILSKDSSANQACACITPNSKVNILWLYAALIAIRPKVLNMRKGVRQKNLNLQMIKELRIPYVNLNEQNEYVKIFKRIYQSKLKF
ncbi:restriction endonuclease subunit S [Succinatimonas hippei]|uniref:restriction endonuclease subunit S n=1 Tax=Succinatimonas hippei TaxID=626938 RepID=UPI00255C4911|nr:restriction endonuclease subunit S [Succinatimonas hippei]